MSRLRVLHITSVLGVGGRESVIRSLIEHAANGIEPAVCVIGPKEANSFTKAIEGSKVLSWYLGKRPGFRPVTYWSLARVLNRVKPQVVHTHGFVLQYVTPVLIWHRVPVRVHTFHGDPLNDWTPLVHPISFGMAGFNAVCVSKAGLERLNAKFPWVRARFIPNGINTAQCRRDPAIRRSMRARLGLPPDEIILVTVARLDRVKRHDVLLKAMELLRQRYLVRLLVVGEGPYKATLLQMTHSLGMDGVVHFIGQRDDVGDVLAAADVFVLASDTEGLPIAVMEAMAAGLPVVATAVGGVPELLGPDVGELVRPGSPAELASGIERLAADAFLRKRLGAAAQRRVLAQFDVTKMVAAYESLYFELYDRGNSTPLPRLP